MNSIIPASGVSIPKQTPFYPYTFNGGWVLCESLLWRSLFATLWL